MEQNDTALKERRIYSYMRDHGFDAVVLGRYDNFAWLTGGGDNRVLLTSETGACVLVLTEQGKYVVALSMDGKRIIEEEMAGMGYELIELKWYGKSVAETVQEMVADRKAAGDIRIPGVKYKPGDFYLLHYPLTAGGMAEPLSGRRHRLCRKRSVKMPGSIGHSQRLSDIQLVYHHHGC